MDRKKFFISMGAGLVGASIVKALPFLNILNKKKEDAVIKVTPNPLAVSRKKIGDKNV